MIAGFTRPRGSRQYLGSLVLGAFKNGQLTYVGRSGGSFGGLDIKTIYDRLKPLVSKQSPFKIKPPEAGEVTWVKPKLVCEVAFTEWTKDGVLRQPIFLQFREDKNPKEATIEKPTQRLR